MPALPHAGKGVYIQGWFSDNSTGGGWLGLTGFRTYYPKYSTLAYWIFQAERIWEMGGTRRTFWTSPEAGHKTLLWGVFLILGVSEHASLRPQEESGLAVFPGLLHLEQQQKRSSIITFPSHISILPQT